MKPENDSKETAGQITLEEPSGAELALTETDAQSVAVILDRHDEAMIVEELQRRALKTMLYAFPMDGKEITDLSYLGVNEAVRIMNNEHGQRITILPESLVVESVEEDLGNGPEPCVQATVYAINERTGYGQYGTSTQSKRMKLADARKVTRAKQKGRYVDDQGTVADQFARQKAVSKAQRNALRTHISEGVRQTLIAQYAGDTDRIKRIEVGAGAQKLADLPAPLTDNRAEQQKTEARELFDELREINPLAVLPAVFHTYLTRAEHSHERLDDFLKFLRDKIEEQAQEARQAP